MSENPYQSPNAVGVVGGTREELRQVATYQKGVLLCILIQLVAIVAQVFVPPEIRLLVSLASLVVGLAATVFVFLLAIKVYSTGLGVLLGILTLIPCVGLLMLLFVNGKATSVLKQNGIRVGLLGANLSEV
jgi:hypothetical protein